jgi:hypothetical protein
MATRAELISRVMKNLGVWQAGQDLPPEDYNVIDEDLDRHLAAMGKADVYLVEDPQNINDEAFTEIANYLASEYAGVFGIAGEELAELKQRAALADQALRYQRTMVPTYQVAQAVYF